jgi:hypothetical protein
MIKIKIITKVFKKTHSLKSFPMKIQIFQRSMNETLKLNQYIQNWFDNKHK